MPRTQNPEQRVSQVMAETGAPAKARTFGAANFKVTWNQP